ncbi:MAG: methyltransferase domain-containing protein [Phycisphaerae bacterium]|nr:methyltransferase domain-containing protein [Phycisphaerae bacterium]
MQRRVDPEFIDDPRATPRQLRQAMFGMRVVNRTMGGISGLVRHLARWSARWPTDRPITLLDMGTGLADIPLAAVAWARKRGIELRVTAIDANERVLESARAHVAREPWITVECLDALSLEERFAPRSFDYAHAGMFLHHFDEDGVVRLLRTMDRLTRAGFVWNDLLRTWRGYVPAYLVTLPCPRALRHDARASLRAGFVEPEVRDLARRAGIDYAEYREQYFFQRFTLAGERPGAWGSTSAATGP